MRALVCRLAGLLIATALLASHAGASVIGKDDRTDVPGEHRRLADGIGLLYNAEASYACTAFCVAADVIATGAGAVITGFGQPHLDRSATLADQSPATIATV